VLQTVLQIVLQIVLQAGGVSRGVAAKSSAAQSAETRLTFTLVCIVAMFLILVTPSELVNLYFYAARPANTKLLSETIVITNALQTANFSFNFVLQRRGTQNQGQGQGRASLLAKQTNL